MFALEYNDARIPLRGELRLGRSAHCELVLLGVGVSRQHAVVRLEGRGPVIEDLGSRNGTTVNGSVIAGTQLLRDGDVVGIGTDILIVRAVKQDMPPLSQPTLRSNRPEEETAALRVGSTLELMETVIHNVKGVPEPHRANALKRGVDSLVRQGPHDRATAERIARMAETISGWISDGSLDPWHRSVIVAVGLSPTYRATRPPRS